MKKKKSALKMLLMFTALLAAFVTIMIGNATNVNATDGVEDFVNRMYSNILEREPDAGSQTWVDVLKDGSYTGSQVAEGFIMSNEFLAKGINNEEFVKIMYRAFFGREADAKGLADWVGFLDNGYIKRFVLMGFANSDEFKALCTEYGITAGEIELTIAECTPGLSEQDFNIWNFVERLYKEVLGRKPDQSGLDTWVGVLKDGSYTGAKAAAGFIMSNEFINKDMTDDEFVKIMYKAFFGRNADSVGLETWTNALATGWTKEEVFAGFANSAEFGVLCDSYGITQGEVLPEEPGDSEEEEATELSIMLPYGSHDYDELDLTIAFRDRLEEYTNTKISWELYDAAEYYEKLTLKYAAGTLPAIVVSDQNIDFMSACKYGVYWDVKDYLKLFDNLSAIPDAVVCNASVNGKLYGIPRSRNLGRNACSYRQDWADSLGLGHPETIDDLYEMAVAFTYNDPDGNGLNDTYGFGLDSWAGQWDIMMPWFGVHNVWGIDENGELEYYVEQEEFVTALKNFRKWNAEGLINEGWESLGAGRAEKTIFRANIAGIQVQVADATRKSQEAMNGTAALPGAYPEARFTYFGSVDGGYGNRVLPTTGYAGYVAVSKSEVSTEDKLMKALQFLNDINDAEMRNLIDFGLEGKDYYVGEDGYAVRYTIDEKTAMGISTATYREGYNQMVSYFSNAEETSKLLKANDATTEIRKAEIAIKAENEKYVVPNKAAGFTSETYIEIGADLDGHIEDLIRTYILGEIDDEALEAGIEQWYAMGGQDYIDEIKAAYEAAN